MPTAVPNSVARGAISRMSRAPTITRDNTSSPTVFVPNQCAAEGASLVSGCSAAVALKGANQVPKMRADDPPENDHRADDERLGAEELAELLAADTCPPRRRVRPRRRAGGAPGPSSAGTRRSTGATRRGSSPAVIPPSPA